MRVQPCSFSAGPKPPDLPAPIRQRLALNGGHSLTPPYWREISNILNTLGPEARPYEFSRPARYRAVISNAYMAHQLMELVDVFQVFENLPQRDHPLPVSVTEFAKRKGCLAEVHQVVFRFESQVRDMYQQKRRMAQDQMHHALDQLQPLVVDWVGGEEAYGQLVPIGKAYRKRLDTYQEGF